MKIKKRRGSGTDSQEIIVVHKRPYEWKDSAVKTELIKHFSSRSIKRTIFIIQVP